MAKVAAELQYSEEHEWVSREDGNVMGLGGDGAPKAKSDAKPERAPLKSNSNRDWIRRAFDPSANR